MLAGEVEGVSEVAQCARPPISVSSPPIEILRRMLKDERVVEVAVVLMGRTELSQSPRLANEVTKLTVQFGRAMEARQRLGSIPNLRCRDPHVLEKLGLRAGITVRERRHQRQLEHDRPSCPIARPGVILAHREDEIRGQHMLSRFVKQRQQVLDRWRLGIDPAKRVAVCLYRIGVPGLKPSFREHLSGVEDSALIPCGDAREGC